MIQKALFLTTLLSFFWAYRVAQNVQEHSAAKTKMWKQMRTWSHWEYAAIHPSSTAFVAGFNAQGAPLYSAMTRRGNYTAIGSYMAGSQGASVITDDEPALAVPFKLLLGDFRTYPSIDGAFAAVQAGFDDKGHPQFLCVASTETGKYPGYYTQNRGKCRFVIEGEKKVRETDDFQFVG